MSVETRVVSVLAFEAILTVFVLGGSVLFRGAWGGPVPIGSLMTAIWLYGSIGAGSIFLLTLPFGHRTRGR